MMNNDMNRTTTTTTTTVDPETMKIDPKVVKKMIASALVEVDGYLGTANTGLSGLTNILKKNNTEEEDALSGISVSMKDNEADVNIKVITEAGKNIPTIVSAIVEKVTARMNEVGGIVAKQVFVEVADTMTQAEYNEKNPKAVAAENDENE